MCVPGRAQRGGKGARGVHHGREPRDGACPEPSLQKILLLAPGIRAQKGQEATGAAGTPQGNVGAAPPARGQRRCLQSTSSKGES